MMTKLSHLPARLIPPSQEMTATSPCLSHSQAHRPSSSIRTLAALTTAGIFFAGSLFAQRPRAQSAAAPAEVLVADFNHDGIPDVLVPSAAGPTATIAFGSIPLGTFSSITKAVTMPAPCILPTQGSIANGSIVAADFNGDGFADLYFTCGTSANTLATITGVMLGKGDGTFAPPVLLNAPYANSGVSGDFNHDGKMDLVLVSYPNGFYFGTNNQHPALLFFAGNGDGTFSTPITSSLGTSPTFEPGQFQFISPVAADVDGDGYPDILLNGAYGYTPTNFNGATLTISVFGNRKDGTFGAVSQATRLPDVTAAVGTYPAAQDLKLIPGNFFGGALPAFAVPDTGSNAGIFLVRNTSTAGSFSLAPATKSTYAGLQNAAGATFTGSGFTDLLVSNGTSLNALINDGSGNFAGSGANAVVYNGLSLATTNPLFAAADANGDGYSDVYTASFNSGNLVLNVNLVSGSATATSAPFTLPLGTTEIAANWPGNVNYSGSSVSGSQTVAKTTPVVMVTSSQNPAPLNTPVTFTALVASPTAIGQIPTGSILFTDGATTLGTVPLDSTGAATFTLSTLTATTHSLQAAYAGDSFFAPATGALTEGITGPGQLTANLLLNPGAELGLVNGAIPYWTPTGQGSPTLDTGTFDGGINPNSGTYDFLGQNGPSDSLSQTVSVVTPGTTTAMLDSGILRAGLSFYEQGLNQGSPSDDASVTLTFLDGNGTTLSTVNSGEVDSHNNAWQNFSGAYPIPAGTRSITYTMNFIRHAGSDLDAFVDDNSLLILAAAPAAITPTLTWTAPAAIPYGTPLSATQLTAVATSPAGASIPGVYTYTPAAGAILPVGTQTLSVVFTPADLSAFTTATTTVPLTILPITSTIALALTSGNIAVTALPQGTAITLTATVLSGAAAITPGQVNFCDASAPFCADIHLLGSAQLTPAGTATLRLIPGIGTHTYKAIFLGNTTYTGVSSTSATLSVTGTYATTTSATPSGSAGNYTLTATISGSGSPIASPTGIVSVVDSSNANAVLGTATLSTPTLTQTFPIQTKASGLVGSSIILTADFNHDGIADVIMGSSVNSSSSSNQSFSVFLGNGDGTFTLKSALSSQGVNVLAGDFNNDGNLDLAVSSLSNLSILLGNGDGTFTLKSQPNVPGATLVADFNHDGILDLAYTTDNVNSTSQTASGSVTVLLGAGDGTFSALRPFTTPSYASAALTADFNGDGIPDILATGYGAVPGGTASAFLGNGDGTFTLKSTIATSGAVAAADLNGDGIPDFVTLNFYDTSVSTFLGKGDGTFTFKQTVQNPTGVANGSNAFQIAFADFNRDGIADVAVTADDGVFIYRGAGDGTFTITSQAVPQTINPFSGEDSGLAVGDFNNDGLPDLITIVGSSTATNILLSLNTLTAVSSAAVINISPIGSGTHQIVASYPGDSNFAASTSAPIALSAQPLATIVTWTPAVATIVYGTPLGPQQLNATALSSTGAPIAGTFTYTPAIGAILTAGSQTLQVVFTPTSPLYSAVTSTQTITVARATPTLAWPTPDAISFGTALSATQLDATATGAASASLPGVFTYTPAAGTVLTPGTQTLSVAFAPTDTLDYTAANATVQLQVSAAMLTSITPNTAKVGDPDKLITLTGTGFIASSVAQLNGARLATTFVNATTLTAIVPAVNFGSTGILQITVLSPANSSTTAALPFTVTAPTPAVTLTGPSTTAPGTQPSLSLAIANPYPIPLTATFTLTFTSAVTPTVDDPSIQFANGGRTFTFTVPANSTTVPAIQLQAGTVAGTITIPLTLTAAGANVTPATIQPLTIVVPGSVPAVSTATLTRVGTQLTVTIHGFSNTREVAQAAFHFMPATGAQIDTPDVSIPVTSIFAGWFSSAPSAQYGSSFTYTQIFSVSDTTANIGAVQVTLTNAVGVSTVYTAQ